MEKNQINLRARNALRTGAPTDGRRRGRTRSMRRRNDLFRQVVVYERRIVGDQLWKKPEQLGSSGFESIAAG